MVVQSRSGIETTLSHWLSTIPMEPQQIDEAVEKVQMLVLKTFSFIRSQISDQIELVRERFSPPFSTWGASSHCEIPMSFWGLLFSSGFVYSKSFKCNSSFIEITTTSYSLRVCVVDGIPLL